MSIIIKDLKKNFGSQEVLKGINLEINSGEVVGFLGPNGAGKSTTMKIITSYLEPTSGSVQVCGLSSEKSKLEYSKKIGYLPENNPLYLDMYVKEYLNYIANIYKLGKQSNKKVEDIIGQTGLSPERSKKIGALSKGYRQRVGLAQALLPDPEVLILDEPTTGLDPNQIIEVRDLIKEIGKHKTVMLSTHIMQEVTAICERVVIINKGNIVADENVNDIQKLKNGSNFTIEVGFVKNVSIEALSELPGVNSVEAVGENYFKISSEKDVRESIFDWAVFSKNKIINLGIKSQSLEDVFRQLTN